METIVRAALLGMFVMLAGTLPRNALFAANLRYGSGVAWAVPVTAVFLGFFWRYLAGWGPPRSSAEFRRTSLRAEAVSGRVWAWALLSGGLGIVALVFALRVANRLVVLPQQTLPDLGGVPRHTVLALLLMAAPVAGVIEEAAFRGYMQGPIERRHGLFIAILVTGTLFAIAHLDFTWILWPYYVAVAALYGAITSRTGSILPAVVLHSSGNLYSNFDLWRHGRAEWQAASGGSGLVWKSGADPAFWTAGGMLLLVSAAMAWSFAGLARAARSSPARAPSVQAADS